MSPEERRAEVISVLACGLIRLEPAMHIEPQNPPDSDQKALGVSASGRPLVAVG
jgi:hypothetical protein